MELKIGYASDPGSQHQDLNIFISRKRREQSIVKIIQVATMIFIATLREDSAVRRNSVAYL